jgi:hypothetical protein
MPAQQENTTYTESYTKKRYSIHSIGLIAGIALFIIILLMPFPTSMERSGYDTLSSRLPSDVEASIEAGFGDEITSDTFSSFFSLCRGIDIAFSKTGLTAREGIGWCFLLPVRHSPLP